MSSKKMNSIQLISGIILVILLVYSLVYGRCCPDSCEQRTLCLAGHTVAYSVPKGQKVYFFTIDQYFFTIALLLALALLLRLHPALNKAGQIVSALVLGISCYSLVEIIYGNFLIQLPGSKNPDIDAISQELNVYFIHRCYQYIPLALMAFILFYPGSKEETTFLKAGDWNTETGVLDPRHPMPWKKVVLRISLYASVLAALALVLRIHSHYLLRPLHSQLVLLPSDILGAANNCFVEEFIFRAMLLTVFCRAIGPRWGNILQAFLFGLVHFPSFNIYHYLAKIVVFSFIGWLFGKATLETGGIKCNWIMHTVIVISMYIAQTV
jgi:membrane protease YdiL (CAAX protease family)